MRTVLGLSAIVLGLVTGVWLFFWVQSETGVLLGRWTWFLAMPVSLASLATSWAGLVLYRSTDLPRGEQPIPMAKLFTRLGASLLLCTGLFVSLFIQPMYEVSDEEMSYSLQQGEWVWILPKEWLGSPGLDKGDIVLVSDPLDPSRRVLRRVMAGPGQVVEYSLGELSLKPRITRKVMNETPVSREGTEGSWNVHSETLFGTPHKKLVEEGKMDKAVPGEGPDRISFLTHDRNQTLRWSLGQGLEDDSQGSSGPSRYRVTVPEGHWYLMADDRDVALDSRWWGPIAEAEIQGVVRVHRAQEDLWREPWQILRPVR